ncbi:5'-methylthioadenosine/S-adenosylhomocysteine nucleosidase [uncultured Winogradskyella sp.]|uniref:5'-methylthioadenosine/S-adenosylhomocysteine nucleosidase family protein n=1 Tax=uncultured Winogradskyella sp. TaxID=395353 RepID=UPI00260C0AB7|nr:5'-methylthioadenosine/S-adenosylhomocysteine nucleosidase [uncultured Winogradskyella sp.]
MPESIDTQEESLLKAVIITAIPIEFTSTCEHLRDVIEITHPKGTVYEKGIFEGEERNWEVGVAQVGAGNIQCGLETERAIDYFNPRVVIFVGIAGGFKDDITFGDIVVAERAYAYEHGKIKNGKMLTRPESGKSSYAMLQRAMAVARRDDWKYRIKKTNKEYPNPSAIVKPIAAGEKVIADSQSEVAELLRTHYNDTAAIEMEGYGFYKAIEDNEGVLGLIVRGISDMLDNKEDRFQELASVNASAFAFEVLSKLKI